MVGRSDRLESSLRVRSWRHVAVGNAGRHRRGAGELRGRSGDREPGRDDDHERQRHRLQNGSGSAVTYTAPFGPYFSAYDKSGDLFVDGSGQTPLAELPKGGSSFEPIATNQTIIFPAGLQWHGKDLAVGDLDTSTIYQFSITASAATLTTTTSLFGAGSGDFWIQKNRVIASAGANVGIWKFPAGGSPQKTFPGSFYGSVDVVMSTVK